jgi:putative intracellular protease/amidase
MTRILMIVTSYGRIEKADQPTGAWLEELAASYYVFHDAGYEIDIASPKGGAGPLDPLSLEEPWLTAHGKRFQADPTATAKLAGTLPLSRIRARDYAALYLVGGAATAWDFPADPVIAAAVGELHAARRPVAGVCHGVLGLTSAVDAGGRSILAGRRVTGISNAEETLTGFDKLVPLLPENRLRELGGQYSCAAPLEAHVQVDGYVLTGQNPASAGPLAEAVVRVLAGGTTAA